MDEDASIPSTPGINAGSPEDTEAKDLAVLQTYLDQVPYQCESPEEMDTKLQEIVGKLIVCSKTKNWPVLTTWDGALQCWLLLRYPINKPTRANLVAFYYHLSLLPGIEPKLVRGWVDMITRLLPQKPGQKRKLEISDLELPWKPLWRALQRELWPRTRLQDGSRNMVNILLYLAEHCKGHFSPADVPEILDTMVPLVTKETMLTMIPVMTSFMPLTHTHLYLPLFMRLWEGFNSSVADDRFLDLLGAIAERHVAGHLGPHGHEGNVRWKEVGIFTSDEWNFLVSKALGSMHVPVGAAKGAGASALLADLVDPQSMRIKKTINRYHALAKIFVYSMSQDSIVRADSDAVEGCLAGSRALDSLDKLVTGTETFFHPSNAGPWSIALTSFVQHLISEFGKRWHAEEQSECKTPINQRLTPDIRRNFVIVLHTPCLLAMFSKDPISAAYAQSALRSLALLEPSLVMPELLERAYDGLEAVIETHRTTAVLAMLTGIVRPLVCEDAWLGGQKHVVPLLMGTLAGIDLNDPVKTICATRFIIAVAQLIKIGDLSGKPVVTDDATMEVDDNYPTLPEGAESGLGAILSRREERALARDTTANFADWVTSLFRRVFALYENLPEEGGRRNTTGGKQEETVLHSIKAMLDVVCIHLSEPLFDLVLNLVFDYAATNAKANAVKAFGQLIGSLARSRPDKTLSKFLPLCTSQIEDELKHGASSMRTTSTHAAVPSDTTLHWNLAILRGCWGYGGSTLVQKKKEIFRILTLLIDKTRSERGYSSTCRLITRIAHTLSGTYPLNNQLVNTEQWDAEDFDNDHMRFWGQQYQAKDVILEWHVPNDEEIEFILELADTIVSPALDTVERILDLAKWDEISRNDFCRYLHVSRALWAGLAMFLSDQCTSSASLCLHSDTECEGLIVKNIGVRAGFVLDDPNDPRYQRAAAHRSRFGQVLKRASSILSATAGEDPIDPIMGVLKSIDIYMLEYGMSRGSFDQLQKAFRQSRDINRSWVDDKNNSRLVFVKRAQVYHSGRVYVQTLYRRRAELDDTLLRELKEASLSHYTRVRRYAQAVLHNVCSYYVRSARLILSDVLEVVRSEVVPDRKKGALYILANKGISAYALSDTTYPDFLNALLQCQNEEKPSIQKLVNDLSSECLSHLQEETVNTFAYTDKTDELEPAISNLAGFAIVDRGLFSEAQSKNEARVDKRQKLHQEAVGSILAIANNPKTHWRYVLIALRFLNQLCRRDAVPSPMILKFFISQTLSPQPSIRKVAQRAVIKSLAFVKLRTYTAGLTELWLEEVENPLMRKVIAQEEETRIFQDFTDDSTQHNGLFVDKIQTGFLTWSATLKAYVPSAEAPSISTWESASSPALGSVHEFLMSGEYFKQLSTLWGQESSVDVSILDVRTHNLDLVKSLIQTYDDLVPSALAAVDELLLDADKFKQRAGAEVLAGILRGIKHYPHASSDTIWAWTIDRLDRAFPQIKPDTVSIWESLLSLQLNHRDPHRNRRLVNWILSRPLELQGDSAFEMVKNLSIFGILIESLGMRGKPLMNKHILPLFENINTPYAEVRGHISHIISFAVRDAWRPAYSSVQELLQACDNAAADDPLRMNSPAYLTQMADMQDKLTRSREERLPPPRVNQSEYDKCGLSILTWIWLLAHSPQAGLVFPYVVSLIPEALRMTSIQDNSEIQAMSTAVLYALSSVAAPKQYVGVILDHFIEAITKSDSWRVRRHALPIVLVFYFRNLLSIPSRTVSKLLDVLVECLQDDNIDVRSMAANVLAGVVRCSKKEFLRARIPTLKAAFLRTANHTKLPSRRDPGYADALRLLHSAILGLCSLIESFPYSPVEDWMPSLIEVLANHSTDPPPVSTTIRKCASEFKKTHQDTWAKDATSFSASQISDLYTILAGTSYYA